MPDASGTLQAVATEPFEGLAGRRLLVLLHGYGADERDLLPVAEALGGGDVVVSFRGPITLGPGAAWADGPSETILAGTGLRSAALRVLATIDALVAQAGAPDAVRLLGFSQGGAVALSAAREAPERFDRVVVLAGFVPAGWAEEEGSSGPLPPVFWGSGDADTVIPPAAVARTDAWLRAHADAEIRRYPGLTHGIAPDEIADVAAFLARP